ncbi:hypothetical protein BGZ59_007800 [Podila verticillata]|nr:hypothetical protein BGZ59_007800 [Podila verticillata]
MSTTSPSTSKGEHRAGDEETSKILGIVPDADVSSPPPATPSATTDPAVQPPDEPPKIAFIRNCDITDLRNSPNPSTRQTVVYIFRQILMVELLALCIVLLSIVVRGHFSLEQMRKNLHNFAYVLQLFFLADFFRVIGEIVRNAMPLRPEDKNKDQDDSAFEPTGNLVADEIKRRRWALFPARPAPKRPQDSRPLVAPGALSSNYGATQSCDPCTDLTLPSSSTSTSSISPPLLGTTPSENASLSHPTASLDPSKPTLVSVTKLAYSAQAVVILYPIRYIPIHFLILFFTSSDIVRRYDCLKQPKCSSGDEGSQLWFVVIIATDVCIQLVYVIESIVLYRARKRIKRLMDDDEAAKEAQVHGDIAV